MSKKAVVLGCGKVGSVMARDLVDNCDCTVITADPSPDALAQVEGVERLAATLL